MKKRLFNHGIAIIGIAVLVFFAIGSATRSTGPTRPSVKKIIEIVNNTGAVISDVYVRDTGENIWGGPKNGRARTKQEETDYHGLRAYSTVYVRDSNGQIIYDKTDIANGYSYSHTVIVYGTEENPPTLPPNIDIKVIDSNGIVYGKYNVDLATTGRVTFTSTDMHPILTMQNNTGLQISITSPSTATVLNGDSAAYQMPELITDRNHTVSYSVNNYTFSQEVTLDSHKTVTLTERPPAIIVKNNTGYPIVITSPWTQIVSNGSASSYVKQQSRTANERHTVIYTSGSWKYTKEVMLDNEDVTLTLTENDRPPVITIQNNTGSTINIVFMRVQGSLNWPNENILTLRLNEDGTLDTVDAGTGAGVRAGSFTNRESFRFWLGNFPVSPDRYDIRIDDVNSASYVKSNIQITSDITLTYTQSDKR